MLKINNKNHTGKDVFFAVFLYLSLVSAGVVLGVSFVSKELSVDHDIEDFSTASVSKSVYQCGQAAIYERDSSDLFFIMVNVNEKSVPMLIDTGATNSSLPFNLSYALKPSSSDEPLNYIPIETAGGHTSAEVFPRQSISINGQRLDVDMLLLQSHSDSGILGMDVLANFEMVFSGRALKLTSRC
ncbi:hypothetical protein CL689_03960 [Candidatus Saccharibacteria bacterium]|nr:hypothetical protein [Candidatus Saccharibacteria bacterium]